MQIFIGDDMEQLREWGTEFYCTLKTRIDGLNLTDDIEISMNSHILNFREHKRNQFAWNSFSVDTIEWDIPREALHAGWNTLSVARKRRYPEYRGYVEVQEVELSLRFPDEFKYSGISSKQENCLAR